MSAQPGILIGYNPITSYSGTSQTNFIGPQSAAGNRGTLPTFTNSNTLFVNGTTGSDSNAGTSASPFATIHKAFDTVGTQATAPGQFTDATGNGNTLTATGTVPVLQWPMHPAPAQGNFAAGPFSTSNYFKAPTALLSGATAFTFECYAYFTSFAGIPHLFDYYANSLHSRFYAAATQNLSVQINGGTTYVSTTVLAVNTWYHLALVYTSGGSGGTQFWINGIQDATTATITATLSATSPTFYVGIMEGATDPLTGYMDRVVISSVARTSFPTAWGASNVSAWYNFESSPAMIPAYAATTLQYVVVKDSSLYNENEYINFPDDLPLGAGIYAADGQTPALKMIRGAIPNTYGASTVNSWNSGLTPSYYVSKAGSDSNAGGLATPFLTLSKAVSKATTATAVNIEILDSGTYTESLTPPSVAYNQTIAILAANGQQPFLRTSLFIQGHFNCNPNTSYTTSWSFWGVSIQDYTLGTNFIFNSITGGSFNFNGGSIATNLNLLNVNITTTAFGLANSMVTSHGNTGAAACVNTLTISNCSFSSQNSGGFDYSVVSAMVSKSSFSNIYNSITGSGAASNITVNACEFTNMGLYLETYQLSSNNQWIVKNCIFNSCQLAISGIGSSGNLNILATVSNCFVQNYIGESATSYGGFLLYSEYSTITLNARDCVAVGCKYGFYYTSFAGASYAGNVFNCTTLNCSTEGVNLPNAFNLTGHLDYGSATPWNTGMTVSLSYSSATGSQVISPSSGSPNAALNPTSPATFSGNQIGTKSAGAQHGLVMVNGALTLNGLTLAGQENLEGGACQGATWQEPTFVGQSISAAFCDFQSVGLFGILNEFGAVSNCSFETNGYGVQTLYATVSNCTFNNCGSAGIGCWGPTSISACSSYGCLYGLYEANGVNSSVVNSIFSASGAYDYSGNAIPAYCDIGTVDPSQNGYLGTGCTQLNPLFRNPSLVWNLSGLGFTGGDLRLQAITASTPSSNPPIIYYFDSPAKGTSSGGADMGAFAFTYGSISTSWTTINLGGTDGSGHNYRNPDQLLRTKEPIHYSENTRENGDTEAYAAAYVQGYKFTWNEDNDMCAAQVADLILLYDCSTTLVRLDFTGTGSSYANYVLLKKNNLEWEEQPSTGYTDTTVPTPVKELDFRAQP